MDRLSIRERPPGPPIMYQDWGKLLFLHWPVAPEVVRPLVPARLRLDLYEGRAWVSVTPFTLWGIRPVFLPALPLFSSSHELNVRTYVHLDGVPGVWFLSLDASNPLAVLGARVAFHLPYYSARMRLEEEGERVSFLSRRAHPGAPPAELEAAWIRGAPREPARAGTLDFFLAERYCLYAEHGERLLRTRIHHPPWLLREARLSSLRSTMLESHGIPSPPEAPLVHAQAASLHVGIWRPHEV